MSWLWSFIYKVLEFFGFGEYIIEWIKILNTNFRTSILKVVSSQNNLTFKGDVDKVILLHHIFSFYVLKSLQTWLKK